MPENPILVQISSEILFLVQVSSEILFLVQVSSEILQIKEIFGRLNLENKNWHM